VLKQADVREKFNNVAFEPIGGPPARLAQTVKSDAAKFSRFVRETGVKIE
jgi:tripartite-type tricarboxylate transporter receptor subunit TctC